MISQDTIDKVREANIVDVVSDYVQLKRTGANFTACCPFHDEKTPSFVVSPAKQLYKCFGCGESGTVIDFVMQKECIEFPDAVKLLADKLHVLVEYEYDTKDPDQKKKADDAQQMYRINESAMRRYIPALEEAPDYVQHDLFGNRCYTEETIRYWRLGYAPADFKFITKPAIDSGVHSLSLKLGLCKTRDGKNYDFFVDRLMFPILDLRGRVAGFGGRTYDKKYAKYLNSKDSDIYHKDNLLYGLFQNKEGIRREGSAVLTEGYTDVISLWQAGIDYAVAGCGTAFTDAQARTLQRYTDSVYLWYDGDAAGKQAAFKSLAILLKHNFQVMIVRSPEGSDPDTLSRSQILSQFLDSADDAVLYLCGWILDGAVSISERDAAIDSVSDLLSHIGKVFKIDSYIRHLVQAYKSIYGFKAADIKDRVHKIQQARLNTSAKRLDKNDPNLPGDKVQRNDLMRYGFYANSSEGPDYGYYFKDKTGIDKKSNFTLKPIGLIDSFDQPKRIFEIRNEIGQKSIIDLLIEDFVSLQRFKIRVEAKGKFLFDGTVTNMNMLKHKLFSEERVFEEIKVLGYHADGFYSFCNGIYNGQWKEIDEYGVVSHGKKHYFIPALSAIYQQAKSAYPHMKPFVHKPQGVGFERWSKLYYDVYDKTNGTVGILFFLASIHRDIFFEKLSFFPLGFFFGMPGTGKTAAGESLVSMFGDRLELTNLTGTTKPGFYRKLNQYCNAIVGFDEYKNDLDSEMIEALKSAWNGQSYNKGVRSQDNTTSKLDVESAMLILGQHLPTADPALFERCVLLVFSERKFNRELFNELKELELRGLTSVLIQAFQCRERIVEEFFDTYNALVTRMSDDLHTKYHLEKFKDRYVKNYAVLLTVYELMRDDLVFPFTEKQCYETVMGALASQIKMMGGSNDLAQWWDTIQVLSNEHAIRPNYEYKIVRSVEDDCNVLYIRFTLVHSAYMIKYRQTRGKIGLEKNSIMSYLKSAPEFMGSVGNTRFGRSQGSAFLFNYDVIQECYDINLKMAEEEDDPAGEGDAIPFPDGESPPNDLPF